MARQSVINRTRWGAAKRLGLPKREARTIEHIAILAAAAAATKTGSNLRAAKAAGLVPVNARAHSASMHRIMHARYAIKRELRAGRIARPAACSACGKLGRTEAHHSDYSKPLSVDWLCRSCHAKRHPRRPC